MFQLLSLKLITTAMTSIKFLQLSNDVACVDVAAVPHLSSRSLDVRSVEAVADPSILMTPAGNVTAPPLLATVDCCPLSLSNLNQFKKFQRPVTKICHDVCGSSPSSVKAALPLVQLLPSLSLINPAAHLVLLKTLKTCQFVCLILLISPLT